MKMFFVAFAILTVLMASNVESKEKCRITKYTKYECPNKHNSAGKVPRLGDAAVSRDIERKYNLKFGDKLHILGVGIYTFMDRTSVHLQKTVDIYEHTKKSAFQFGVKYKVVEFK